MCVFADGGVGCVVWFGVWRVVWCRVVYVSLGDNGLCVEGGAAMAGAVQHLTSLTTLEYV